MPHDATEAEECDATKADLQTNARNKKVLCNKNLGLFRSATRKISADFALIGAGKT